MVYKFFDKKSSGSGIAVSEPNYQFAKQMKFRDRLLENSNIKEKFFHLLEIIFEVLI